MNDERELDDRRLAELDYITTLEQTLHDIRQHEDKILALRKQLYSLTESFSRSQWGDMYGAE